MRSPISCQTPLLSPFYAARAPARIPPDLARSLYRCPPGIGRTRWTAEREEEVSPLRNVLEIRAAGLGRGLPLHGRRTLCGSCRTLRGLSGLRLARFELLLVLLL